ncbi:MAG: beta-ketoacyl-ACP synthase II [Candidatus Latescibacter sp.]|nr:beta-ketoacyl-ACP synthase II [Candidatus Latescibacter sp.]
MGSKRRVVITGMGVICPIGNNLNEFWNALKIGRSGIGIITRFDATNYKTRIAGEVKNFSPEPIIDAHEAKRIDLFSQYAVCTAYEAIKQSGLSMENEDPYRTGVVFGSGIGGINVLEEQVSILINKGPGRVSPFYIPGMISDIAAGHIAMMFGLRGPNYATVSACASGAHAIGTAYHEILRGDADVMITGGSEGSISPSSIAGFINIKALSRRNEEPQKASRPFDRDRDGFVMGEGGAALVLEELEHARKRGAPIFAELTGVGFTADAYHITAPLPDGASAARSMELAVEKSGMSKKDVDYINCHCPSTQAGDAAETNSIKRAFGPKAYDMNVSSTKSMTGHLLGGAGSVEFVATILAVMNNVIPPTINYENPDPECDLNCTPNVAVEREVAFALSNSFGFGGHNATLAVKKFCDE